MINPWLTYSYFSHTGLDILFFAHWSSIHQLLFPLKVVYFVTHLLSFSGAYRALSFCSISKPANCLRDLRTIFWTSNEKQICLVEYNWEETKAQLYYFEWESLLATRLFCMAIVWGNSIFSHFYSSNDEPHPQLQTGMEHLKWQFGNRAWKLHSL